MSTQESRSPSGHNSLRPDASVSRGTPLAPAPDETQSLVPVLSSAPDETQSLVPVLSSRLLSANEASVSDGPRSAVVVAARLPSRACASADRVPGSAVYWDHQGRAVKSQDVV